jgi:hypothetical protein
MQTRKTAAKKTAPTVPTAAPSAAPSATSAPAAPPSVRATSSSAPVAPASTPFTGPTPTVKSRVITRPTTNKDKDAIEAEFKRLWMDLDAKFRAQKDVMRADEQQAAIADLNKGLVSRLFDLSRPPLN